ncbi:MAG: AMP-binding protein [Bacteroidota bacterium]
MTTLHIQDKSYSAEEIKAGNLQFDDEYLRHTVSFCNHWLNKQETFLFNTSGSTGCPMAIEASREQMLASAKGTIQALGLSDTEHIYLCISTKMIGGAMMLVRAMELGCTITIVHPSSNPIDSLNENHPYTFASFVPMQVFDINHNEEMIKKLNGFSNILLGGAPASDDMIKGLEQLKTKVWQTYGMTETLSHIALRQVGTDKYYKALPGVKLKTDDRNCLCIKAEVTNNQWLLTNDMVNLVEEDQFELLGRMDDVINSGGIKIFTYDVEQCIIEKMNQLEMPHKPLFVCRQKDERFGEIVVVVMLGEPLSDDVVQQMTDHCTGKLGKYAAPKHIYFTREFVKLESGKINKQATLQKVLQNS